MFDALQNLSKKQLQAALLLSDRRLSRSEKARHEAETLLEIRSRALSIANDGLRKREAELLGKLEKDSQKLLLAQEVANVATFHIDADGAIVGSRNLASLLGILTHLNNLAQIRAMIHPLESSEAEQFLQFEDESTESDSRDIRFLGQAGKTKWLRWQIRRNPGQNREFHGVVQDITAERQISRRQRASDLLRARQFKRLQRLSAELESRGQQLDDRVAELEKMRGSLEESRDVAVRADQSKSRFLAMMSHDIRTPMNAILATLELLATTQLDEKQSRLLELSRLSGDQMLFLLADLIEVARSDGWNLDLAEDRVETHEFFNDLGDAWMQLAAKKQLSISVEIADQLPSAFTSDQTRMRQLMDNLVSNAVKYTRDGSIDIHAHMVGDDDAPMIHVAIADTGRGMEAAQLDRLFKDGETVLSPLDPAVEGSGLGLAICKRIVDAMGGEIGAESDVGKGSKFWFEIPYVAATKPAEKDKSSALSLGKIRRPDNQIPHILIAEDVEANRIILAGMLEHMGCSYETVEDGLAVIEKIPFHGFDAILMDVSMPRMDGIEATQRIRELAGNEGKIPIIGCTAFAAEEERKVILDAGMDAIITKPIRGQKLREKLEAVIKKLPVLGEGNSVPIPDFGSADLLDGDIVTAQIFAVPESSRGVLIKAVIADLQKWTGNFETALAQQDRDGVSRSHHALKGICAGFGATRLLSVVEASRHAFDDGRNVDMENIRDILANTISGVERMKDTDHPY